MMRHGAPADLPEGRAHAQKARRLRAVKPSTLMRQDYLGTLKTERAFQISIVTELTVLKKGNQGIGKNQILSHLRKFNLAQRTPQTPGGAATLNSSSLTSFWQPNFITPVSFSLLYYLLYTKLGT